MQEKHNKLFTIVVNGRVREYGHKEISFDQVIILAFNAIDSSPNAVYTITYSKNENKSGTMVKGDVVKVKEGMIFNVTRTDKS